LSVFDKPGGMRPHPDQHYGCLTYAQHGDDLMLVNLFRLMGIEKPSYLDVGAHHPFNISNTALLYERGSRGINVEANPELIMAFKVHRPKDINLNFGVATVNGEMDFYMYSNTSGRNTLSREEVAAVKSAMGDPKKIMKVKTVTINHIVDEYSGGKFPDLLTMDIEGMDLPVLRSMNLTVNSPKVICVEIRRPNTNLTRTLLQTMGYFLYCRMGENLFFIRNDLHQAVF